MYLCTRNELSRSRLVEVGALQTHGDITECITTQRLPVGND